ncbi:MAG: hypothetical protein QM756_36550 [Polyangiaceae bacterium]
MSDALPRVPLPSRLARASFALVAALSVASLVGSALSPLLLVRAPALLLALSPDARHVALCAGRLAPEFLVPLVVLRRALFSIGVFGVGMVYGQSGLTWVEARSPWLGKVLRFIERLLARWGALILLVVPFASVCLLAGVARTHFRAFLAASLVGHALWVTSTYYVGTVLSDFVEQVVAFLSEYLFESTVICILLVMAQQLVARRGKRERR